VDFREGSAGCSSRESFRLNNERRYHDWKRPYGKDEAVPMREPHYGPLVHVGVLSWLEVFFVLRGCIARQSSTDAYGGYDELLHGFWGNQLNRGELMPFLDGKASILFLLASSTLAAVASSRIEPRASLPELSIPRLGTSQSLQRAELLDGWPRGSAR
jgi:hypothetical protein